MLTILEFWKRKQPFLTNWIYIQSKLDMQRETYGFFIIQYFRAYTFRVYIEINAHNQALRIDRPMAEYVYHE
jgi:hypothetical protein